MLNPMLPEQVSSAWDIIKYAIEESLPPIAGDHPDKMNRILGSLLSGKLLCWAAYQLDEDNRKFEGLVLTDIVYDTASDTKNLLIYCLYGYAAVSNSTWVEGLESLKKYARSKRCSQIIAYTDQVEITRLVKSLGGEARWTLCTFNIKD
jgi:hypothetical protein